MIYMRRTVFTRKCAVGLLILLAILGAGFSTALYSWLLADIPDLSLVATRKVVPTSSILDKNGQLLYEVIDANSGRQFDLALDSIPQSCIEATLATEDSRFYVHGGFDPLAIARAAFQNFRAGGKVVSGGSTLTQQLVRILLLDDAERYEQSYRRKLREAWLAWRL